MNKKEQDKVLKVIKAGLELIKVIDKRDKEIKKIIKRMKVGNKKLRDSM